VTFSKGVQGRGSFTDEVDYLSLDVLQQVVTNVHAANPQALRPTNLALLSPRVLWSIVYHFILGGGGEAEDGNPTTTTVTDVETALQQVGPTLDWSFLRHRVRNLSAKAQENARQQQEKGNHQEEGEDWEAAAEAIASVEFAMERLSSHNDTQQVLVITSDTANNNAACASTASWRLATPNEVDEDELRACVSQAPYRVLNGTTDTEENDDIARSTEYWVQQLLTKCTIHNWRELACATVVSAVDKKDNNTGSTTTLLQLLSMPCGEDIDSVAAVQCVTSWVTFAQQQSIDEIMVEICDNRVDAVEALMEYARSGTPKDLAAWRYIIPDLHRTLMEGYESTNSTSSLLCPTVTDLNTWCDRAVTVLTEYPWTAAFVTPLNAD
jgi:hypothetical protein